MKILIVTKRFTSAKDITREEVGRPWCLFAALSSLGHEVRFLLGDYTERGCFSAAKGAVAVTVRPLAPWRAVSFRRAIEEELAAGGVGLCIAEGDPLFALLARGACRRASVPLMYDLMDNYETYGIYRIPLFGLCDRRSIRAAGAVVCVTESLREKLRGVRRRGVFVVGNGVDAERFRPMERAECRRRLGLPLEGTLVGYFGYLVAYKGSAVLFRAHEMLRAQGFSATLVLAGNRHRAVALPEQGVISRGIVPHQDIPHYINACDAVVVPNPSNSYTDYSFPLKVLEAAACGVPVAATALRPVRELLGDDYPWLARPGDPSDLALKIAGALSARGPDLRKLAESRTWRRMAAELDNVVIGGHFG